ncbi:retron St85 family RNA-directed DNA polymerase [uncultured Thiothrix sp.]|uniref:retron St85 family RNA-directed DNA polymerase n=1 Tax=uncultured Thiothrix sp. TaxID=223185 RepID=UPI00260B1D23|nr:retron St85 family RNA-directed DNA polymerase [uncultured Thiothrix sp.]HMT91707.1 retron St85 family RNA-directed DNA polymerase [Thiolinea sp.]
MSETLTRYEQIWQAIEKAGSVNAYVREQMQKNGFMVSRRPTDNLSKTELEKYRQELKKEATEQRRLNKEAWQAYKSKHIVHLGEGIYWTDDTSEDQWDLPNAYKRLLENQLPAVTKVAQLCEALKLSVHELRWLCYQREVTEHSHYTRFEIPKRSGGMRAIWAPLPKLKQAQHWILHEILERLVVHGSAHGFITGRSIVSNAAEHINSQMLLKVDVENFFPSISWRRVKGVFRKAGYPEQIATLLALLCTESPREIVEHEGKQVYVALAERCLPQGAPTSPALTNALCLRLDRRLTGFAHKAGWRYTRYADDLTFSLPTTSKNPAEISRLLGTLKRVLGEEGFELNEKKTRVIRQGDVQAVTGLVVNGEQAPRVSRALKRQMRAAVHNLRQGKALPEGESIQRLRGYAAYIAMTDRDLGTSLLGQLQQVQGT